MVLRLFVQRTMKTLLNGNVTIFNNKILAKTCAYVKKNKLFIHQRTLVLVRLTIIFWLFIGVSPNPWSLFSWKT